MLGLRHCRNLVNGWLAPSCTNVWGLLTDHSIVKPRLHKGPRCVGLFAGVFFPSNRFSGTAPHPNTRRRIPPWLLFRSVQKKCMTIPLCHIECVIRVPFSDRFKPPELTVSLLKLLNYIVYITSTNLSYCYFKINLVDINLVDSLFYTSYIIEFLEINPPSVMWNYPLRSQLKLRIEFQCRILYCSEL